MIEFTTLMISLSDYFSDASNNTIYTNKLAELKEVLHKDLYNDKIDLYADFSLDKEDPS